MFKLDAIGLLKVNRMIRSNRLKFLGVLMADLLGWRYTIVRLDPVAACNLRCAMCYFSNPDWVAANTGGRFTNNQLNRLADGFFAEALLLYIGCGFEPTVYKGYPEIVRLAKARGVRFVSLVTNGQLLTEPDLLALIEYGLDEIIVSLHGVRPETYQRLMPGASYQRLHQNLGLLTRLSRAHGQNVPRLRLNFTVNRDTLSELSELLERFAGYDLRCLQVRPMTNLGGALYSGAELSGAFEQYQVEINALKQQCKDRGIVLLVNDDDPSIQHTNPYAVVYENAVLRTISPRCVWMPGLDAEGNYRAFKASIGFRRRLLRWVIYGDSELARSSVLVSSQVSL